MKRWEEGYSSQTLEDGDPPPGAPQGTPAFRGIDMVRDRDKLPPGIVPRAENKRMRTGSCLKRMGNTQPGADFNPVFTSRMIGSGMFNDPNGNELMMVACQGDNFVWALRSGAEPLKVNLVAGQTFTTTWMVRFAQAFDKILLLRPGAPNLVWDGDPGTQFVTFVAANPSTNYIVIPPAWAAEPFTNRILYHYPFHPNVPWRDRIIMSDPGDFTQYHQIWNDIRINSGQSDAMVRVWAYWRNSAVAFKRRTVSLLQDFTAENPDPATTTPPPRGTQRIMTREIGLAAHDCIIDDGADLLFLSEPGGVYRLSEVIQEQIQAPPTPVSERIQPVIDRINWLAAGRYNYVTHGACAGKMKDYGFFAVPLYAGGPNGNDAVLVYNRTSREWESAPDWWEDPRFRIWKMHTANYNGVESLFGLDYVRKRIYVLYRAVPDEVEDSQWHIHDMMETRGYTCGDDTVFKDFQRTAIALNTVDPTITVTAISAGVNEVKNLTPEPITKERLAFYPHAHPPYERGVTDPNEPMREDYSYAELEDAAVQDFETLPVGPISRLPGTTGGLDDAPPQQALEHLPIGANARWLSLRIQNTSGRCDVLAVGVEAILSNMKTRTAA
jgi:hypothetical protein